MSLIEQSSKSGCWRSKQVDRFSDAVRFHTDGMLLYCALLVVVWLLMPLSPIAPVEAPWPVFGQRRIVWVLCHGVENGREEPRRLEYPDPPRLGGKDVLEEVVEVSHHHSQKLDCDRLPKEEGEHHEDPRQVGGPEYQQAEKVHSYHGVPSVDQARSGPLTHFYFLCFLQSRTSL